MGIVSSLHTHILSDSTVGNLIGDRLYPVSLPDDAADYQPPCMTFRVLKTPNDYSMQGPAELGMPQVELIAYSENYLNAHAIADALVARLDRLHGEVGDVYIKSSHFSDAAKDMPFDDKLKLFRVAATYVCWYQRQV